MALLALDRRISVAWVCVTGALLYLVCAEFQGGPFMFLGTLLSMLSMLPMLDKRSPAAPIIIVGYVASAVILGLETIDLAFDITILSGQAPALGIRGPGGQHLLPLEVAWIYYHTMLNAVHVNVVVTFCVALLGLGAAALAMRAAPDDHRRYRFLMVISTLGTLSYALGIVPRYIQLRKEEVFHAYFFSRWGLVAAARLANMLLIVLGQFVAFPLLKSPGSGTAGGRLFWFRGGAGRDRRAHG